MSLMQAGLCVEEVDYKHYFNAMSDLHQACVLLSLDSTTAALMRPAVDLGESHVGVQHRARF